VRTPAAMHFEAAWLTVVFASTVRSPLVALTQISELYPRDTSVGRVSFLEVESKVIPFGAVEEQSLPWTV